MPLLDLSLTIAVYGVGGMLVLLVLQGFLVWLSAHTVSRAIGSTWTLTKIPLMLGSWLAWVVLGIFGWSMVGLPGGMFEGGAWLFGVIPSGIWGTVIATILWVVSDLVRDDVPEGRVD